MHALLFTAVVCVNAARAEDNPRHVFPGPGVNRVETLSQNWSHEESNWFYNAPQGSRLMPYNWFLHLEQPDSNERFLEPSHVYGLGYIPRSASPDNPDALPVGFTKDAAYESGEPSVGVTCAACHTAQFNHDGVAYVVDGAPTLGDMQRLMERLVEALDKTAGDGEKLRRLSDAVLPPDADDADRRVFQQMLSDVANERRGYNERNFPEEPEKRFGHGRVDAFGAIFNEVTSTFLGKPENVRPADAPVSYPALWDAPQHDRVQWNGAAENRTSPLGRVLFGTTQVGALGRNTGEVLGVFGQAEVNQSEFLLPRRYESTAKKPVLLAIEDTLGSLWSPLWPEATLGVLNEGERVRGETLFNQHCASCHASIDRRDPNREVVAKFAHVGTDAKLLENFGRDAVTGRLEGRRKTLLALERFQRTDKAAVILKHVVERVMLDPLAGNQLNAALKQGLAADLEIGPGFRQVANLSVGDSEFSIAVESLSVAEEGVSVKASRADLAQLGTRASELRSAPNERASLEALAAAVEERLGAEGADSESDSTSARLPAARATFAYKARPLNGVWATAPYLHNGSVPTLAELLKPAEDRVKRFHVGGREFDTSNVGFVDDPAYPQYDTTVEGNRNTGHEYGVGLQPEEKEALLEYLKSL